MEERTPFTEAILKSKMNTLLKNLLVKKWASSRLRNSNVAEGLKIRFENRKLLNILCF